MNRIYETLRNDQRFAGKLQLDESTNFLSIVFHEYLRLEYIEGNYTAITDEGLIRLNDHLTHWHIKRDEEAFEIITSAAEGVFVFIESRAFWRGAKLKLMDEVRFIKKKERYMRRKSLRIYTGTEIIKRDG